MCAAGIPQALWYVEAVKTASVLLVLLYTSWLDLRTREVEPRLWLYASLPLAAASLAEAPWIIGHADRLALAVQMAGGLLAVGLMAFLYYAGMMGGGDLFASAMILAAHPWPPLLRGMIIPFLLNTLVYSAVAFLVVVPSMMLYNLVFHRSELARIRGLKARLVVAATAIPMRVDKYIGSESWLFPLEDYRSGERRFRLSFDIDEDPGEHREALRRLVEKGTLSGSDTIWVTYGIPFLIPLTAGYVAAVLLGDRLLVAMLGLLA